MSVDFSLVVACYNEGPTFEASVAETFRVLDALSWRSEVVFIDDASRDGTPAAIDRIVAAHPTRPLTVVKHAVNVGRGGTVTEGLQLATGRYAGFIDIDLEVGAHFLLPCLLALEQGADVVTAHRVYRFQWRSLDRYVLSRGYVWLRRRLVATPVEDTETGFKLFRREAILPVLAQCEDRGWFWDTEVLVRAAHAGLRLREVPVLFLRRFDKQSTVRPIHDTIEYLSKLWRFRAAARRLGGGRESRS